MLKLAIRSIISKHLKNKILEGPSINETELNSILREIRIAMLNSDVHIEVIKSFFEEIKHDLLVKKDYSHKDELDVIVFSVIKKKLMKILGNKVEDLIYEPKKPNRIMIVGLNGSGKTTTTAKLANYLKNTHKAKLRNVSLDVYRPGAYEQLKKLSDSIGVDCFSIQNKNFKEEIRNHLLDLNSDNLDCILFDSYGLLPDNQELLEETENLRKFINPTEVIFVVDAMAGQDMINTIKVFHEKLKITGIIVSKSDSNSPMGAIFSISYLLKIPIKFMGKGEYISDLVTFYPERIASLILGEGDILSLAEKMNQVTDVDVSKKFFQKVMSGHFDLEDLVVQIKEVKKLGSLKSIIKMFPGDFSKRIAALDTVEDQLKIWEILISSMTLKERRNPKIFKKQPNRKVRVIKGSGRKPEELNRLLKKWEDCKKQIEGVISSVKKGKNPMSFFL